MKKSVYSLVLIDELVERLDRAAYTRGQSRSGLINEILAEYLAYTTPEMRMQQVLDAVSRLIGEHGEIQAVNPPSGSGLVLRSAIRYKYNPTVRYSIELFRASDGPAGRLRVQLRTRSEVLLRDADQFFTLWEELELRLRGRADGVVEPGRYTRLLYPEKGLSSQSIGESIASYVDLFDGCLRLYFDNLNDPASAAAGAAARYTAYLRAGRPTL